jgi:hypothetical protein
LSIDWKREERLSNFVAAAGFAETSVFINDLPDGVGPEGTHSSTSMGSTTTVDVFVASWLSDPDAEATALHELAHVEMGHDEDPGYAAALPGIKPRAPIGIEDRGRLMQTRSQPPSSSLLPLRLPMSSDRLSASLRTPRDTGSPVAMVTLNADEPRVRDALLARRRPCLDGLETRHPTQPPRRGEGVPSSTDLRECSSLRPPSSNPQALIPQS